ncbi:hypothetical protein BEN30_14185 [Magnetovibrio blakemorei]|uniref:Uncharacterized protein n=1 Tax=Magnetovibrio blakemorei TaxID=28181 RepID=A0A1E5Q663_9PROT|nr:hypothetical protein BEN30_14185 [Magnetovibrio blakemorei]
MIGISDDKTEAAFVVGSNSSGPFTTSVAPGVFPFFAPDFSGVITPSGSFYRLQKHDENDPDVHETLMIVHAFRIWGYRDVVAHFPGVVF